METMSKLPSLHDVVALLADLPSSHLHRGQVGTVVEILGKDTLLVEFSDDGGRTYAITPVKSSGVLWLNYVPEAA
jgi:catabolite regulation protein CreA